MVQKFLKRGLKPVIAAMDREDAGFRALDRRGELIGFHIGLRKRRRDGEAHL